MCIRFNPSYGGDASVREHYRRLLVHCIKTGLNLQSTGGGMHFYAMRPLLYEDLTSQQLRTQTEPVAAEMSRQQRAGRTGAPTPVVRESTQGGTKPQLARPMLGGSLPKAATYTPDDLSPSSHLTTSSQEGDFQLSIRGRAGIARPTHTPLGHSPLQQLDVAALHGGGAQTSMAEFAETIIAGIARHAEERDRKAQQEAREIAQREAEDRADRRRAEDHRAILMETSLQTMTALLQHLLNTQQAGAVSTPANTPASSAAPAGADDTDPPSQQGPNE